MTSTATQPAAIAAPAPGTHRNDAARSLITFTTRHPCGGPSGTKAFPATVERLDQFAGIPATITSVVIAERRPR